LKFVVMQLEDGDTAVRWLAPEPSFSCYGEPALTALGRELAQLCERIALDALAL
jgi:hypothetical protein